MFQQKIGVSKVLPQGAYLCKSKFINSLVWRGSKLRAEYMFHDIFFKLKMKLLLVNQFEIFYFSIIYLRPLVSLKPFKRGRTTYYAPYTIHEQRKRMVAIKWLLSSSKSSDGALDLSKLVDLLVANFLVKRNAALDKKQALYREALSNRPFIKYLK